MLRAAPGLLGEAAVSVAASQTQMLTTEALVVVAGLESAPGARVAAASAALESGRRLLLAARSGDTATVRSLLAAGAPFTADWLGTSPLHLAAANNHLETVEVLLRAGVSRDARSKVERTPLHVAASAGHAAVVAALLAHGANVDCRDMLGMTPLHWAAERGHTAAARVLLAHGADATVTSKFLKTPLALAARSPAMRALFDAELAARALRQEQQQHQQQHQQQKQQQEEQPKQYKEHTLEELTNIPHGTNAAKLQKTPEKKCIKVKLVNSDQYDAKAFPKTDASAGEAAALLQRHGITLLPHDPGSTVLSALQCGRTVVLSDAGKLMLKESVSPGGAGRARGEEEGAAASPLPSPSKVLQKVGLPHCQRLSTQKVKLIAGAGAVQGGRQVVARPLRPVRLKVRARGSGGAAGGGGGVRLLMDRASLQRLVQGADEVATAQPEIHTKSSTEEEGSEVGRLRAELAVARATIAQLRRQLAARHAPAQ